MSYALRFLVGFLSSLLISCGGGGSAAPGVADAGFPVLIQSASFQMPPITPPPDYAPLASGYRGRVVLLSDAQSAANLSVTLLDTSSPGNPKVVELASTDSKGYFVFSSVASGAAAVKTRVSVTLNDGTALRAFASGWTEISVGSEAAVSEVDRLQLAGSLNLRQLTISELVAAQNSLTLIGVSKFFGQSDSKALGQLIDFIRVHTPWNQLLDRFNSLEVATGAGDVAGFFPVESASLPSTFTSNETGPAVTKQVVFSTKCNNMMLPTKSCDIVSTDVAGVDEHYFMDQSGVALRPSGVVSDNIVARLFFEIGDLALIELPHVVGTRVIYENKRFQFGGIPTARAAVKITRRTYSVEPIQALGRTLQGVRVVLDYEIAILNTDTKEQFDLLAREQRWFSSESGRVQVHSYAQARVGTTVTAVTTSTNATNVTGAFFKPPMAPFPGVADVVSIPLRHRHAVYSGAMNKVYVATDNGMGEIHELDSTTLNTLRKTAVAGSPQRLAVSADGARLYSVLDGRTLIELSTSDLSIVRQISLPKSLEPNVTAENVVNLAIAPFDSSRVLVLLSTGVRSWSSRVLELRNGQFNRVNQPGRSDMPDGWDFPYGELYYLGWSNSVDEFYGQSAISFYKFKFEGALLTKIASSDTVPLTPNIEEFDGDITTSEGVIRNSTSLTEVHRLGPANRDYTWSLGPCSRFDAYTDICGSVVADSYKSIPTQLNGALVRIGNGSVRFDHRTGQAIDSFLPAVETVSSGCANEEIMFNPPQLRAIIGKSKTLWSNPSRFEEQQNCALQIHTMRGL